MDNLFMQRSLAVINGDNPLHAAHWMNTHQLGHLLLVETIGKEHEAITQLIVQLALRGSFNLIATDEWLPDRDTLYRLVHRYTLKIKEILDRPSIRRPLTCLQMLDFLRSADMQGKPTLITNFLYHFYNADFDLSVRDRILEQCCHYTKSLSLSNSVIVLVPRLSAEEYRRFFPILASIANEIISIEETLAIEASQHSLF
jgi:hypothetical protein